MNGEETHEWRLAQLEKRMDDYERLVYRMMLTLVGNLAGVALLLITKIVEQAR